MKTLSFTLICACIALSSASVFAQDTTTHKKDAMTKQPMSAADCRDHNERIAKGDLKEDPASQKITEMCRETLKNSTSTSK